MAGAGLDPAAIQLLRVPGRDSAFALVRQPAADSAGHPARQRRQHPGASARGGAARGSHARARRRRRGALHRRVRGPDARPAADRGQPGPARRVQPAEPAARTRRDLDPAIPEITGAGGAARHRRLAAAAPACARPRMGAGRGRGSDDHDRARPRAPQTRPTIANRETSGLAASHRGRGCRRGRAGSWTPTRAPARSGTLPPRLLDGFKLLSLPETGINIDVVPGPRGPVTFRDLYLRQYVVVPKRRGLASGRPPATRGARRGCRAPPAAPPVPPAPGRAGTRRPAGTWCTGCGWASSSESASSATRSGENAASCANASWLAREVAVGQFPAVRIDGRIGQGFRPAGPGGLAGRGRAAVPQPQQYRDRARYLLRRQRPQQPQDAGGQRDRAAADQPFRMTDVDQFDDGAGRELAVDPLDAGQEQRAAGAQAHLGIPVDVHRSLRSRPYRRSIAWIARAGCPRPGRPCRRGPAG